MAPGTSKPSRAPGLSDNPKSKRTRISWFLRVTTVEGVSQVTIGYKNTRGCVSSYTKSTAYPKIPFGPIAKSEYSQRKVEGGEVVGVFKFTNKSRETALLNEPFMNNLNSGNDGNVDEFSKKITSMIIDKKQKLLAQYLSVLSQSSGFVHHRDEFHEKTGFLSDGTEIQERDFNSAGGSLSEFLLFTEVAKSSAVIVEKELLLTKNNNITNYFKRSGSESSSHKPIKKTRGELLDENENKEIEDLEGLEQEYRKSFIGLASIPLDNVSVAPGLKSEINIFKVQSIADSIKKQYDPSFAVLVVCPEDITEAVDLNDTSNRKFYCIQKIHTLEAFKSLDKDGKFESLVAHCDRTVVAFVVKTDNSAVVHYGHIRADAIESNFFKKFQPQQLLHIFRSLTEEGNENSFKAIDRMCKLCRVGPNEATSIRKLCKWSKDAFKELIKVLVIFEKYETLDVKASGHQSRVTRGEKMPVPNKLINKLSKVDENYFVDGCGKILEKKISLKSLVDGYEIVAGMKKVAAVLSVVAKHKSYETIQQQFPGKFELDKLEPFIGAEVKEGKMNESASRLKKYYNAVVSDSDSPSPDIDMVEFKDFDDLKELKESGVFAKFDTILLVLGKLKKESAEVCLAIADLVINSPETYKSAIIVFPSEDLYFQFMWYIRGKDTSLIAKFDAETLLISCKSKKHQDIEENVSFGAMIGKNISFKFPIKRNQSNIANLKDVIESISPPGASRLLVSDMIPLMKIHSSELVGKVAYYGPPDEIFNFRHLLAKDESFQKVTDDDDEIRSVDEDVSGSEEQAGHTSGAKETKSAIVSYQKEMDEIHDDLDNENND